MAGNPGVKFNLPFTLSLPDSTPTGVDPKVAPYVELMLNAFMQVQLAMHNIFGCGQQLQTLWDLLPANQTLHRFSPNRYYGKASEAISYGAAINLFLSGGLLQIRNANATNNTKPCHGFCTTTGGMTINTFGEAVLCIGLLENVAGLTAGTRYFLSTSNGLLTAAAPVAAGNIEQAVGIGIDSTTLLFNTDFDFIQH